MLSVTVVHVLADVDIIHAGSCGTDQKKNQIKEDCDKITSQMALIHEPLFCASDGRSYYSTRHYNCAVNKNSDWFNYYITQWHAPCQSIDAPCERLRSSQEGLLSQPLCASDGSSYVNSLALMCAITSQPDLTKRHKGACLPEVAPATIALLQEDGEDM
uniref:Kazal-like domain-containing protein n=1 Tax=Timema monikensis TaxID=170555 RepID=A0A7R9HRL5_9NEOP|nr:unnamed protein product [Timema monikensis]